MPDDLQIRHLIEEILESDRTPEEVCSDTPHLLPAVRKRLQQVQRVGYQLDEMFPSDSPTERGGARRPEGDFELPTISGYQVEEILGRGGMGIVFRARHLRLNRTVALKMALAGVCAGPEERDRFQREVEAVAALRHPNVVQIYDVGDADGRPYFTMEFVDGGSLAQKLAGTPQPAGEAAQLVATLARAVQVAHACGIVHRDLKPGNVLLTADGTPKISDFGLARRLQDGTVLTLSGAPMGTPYYMAPEQAQGMAHGVGPAADTYALGAILYELVTGRPPFRAASVLETLQQVISQEPAHPSRLNNQVPRDLETICLKCLHKDPRRRYASAAALADDLGRFREGRPIQARPLGWGARLWRWSRRKPATAALVATALALVGLAIGGGMWAAQQRGERRAEAAQRDWELRNEVGTAVAQAERLRKGFHFHEARELLNQARQRLEPEGPDDLRRQVDRAWADLELVENLDTARLRAAKVEEAMFEPFGAGPLGAEPLYEEAFAKAGLGQPGDDVDVVAARVRGSGVGAEIVAGLDSWAAITHYLSRRKWLLDVARRADPDPARLDDALGHFQEAVRLNPKWGVAHTNLGAALVLKGRPDEAIGHHQEAIRLDPQLALAHSNLGLVLQGKGRLDEAIDHFQEAVRLDPKAAGPHNDLGNVLRLMGRLDEAIDHLQEAVRLNPKSAGAHNNLGVALMQKGRRDEAMSHYEQAVRLDPKLVPAHFNLGLMLREKGRLDEAIGHFQEVVRLDPNLAVARRWLFTCRYDAACAAVRAAGGDDARQPRVDEAERVGLRRRALDWLRANIELTTELLKGGKAVDWSLSAWQTDPALAGVRHRDALAKLPNAEREQWQRLWADVATQLAGTR